MGSAGGGSATISFIRLKIFLDAGDAAEAESHIERASSCADFTPSILEVIVLEDAISQYPFGQGISQERLAHGFIAIYSPSWPQVMCQEAVKAGQLSVAAKALLKLHSRLVIDSAHPLIPSSGSSLTEASCLRALIICLGPQDSKEGQSATDHAEMARVFTLVAER